MLPGSESAWASRGRAGAHRLKVGYAAAGVHRGAERCSGTSVSGGGAGATGQAAMPHGHPHAATVSPS
jgi:hypothetical protein